MGRWEGVRAQQSEKIRLSLSRQIDIETRQRILPGLLKFIRLKENSFVSLNLNPYDAKIRFERVDEFRRNLTDCESDLNNVG